MWRYFVLVLDKSLGFFFDLKWMKIYLYFYFVVGFEIDYTFVYTLKPNWAHSFLCFHSPIRKPNRRPHHLMKIIDSFVNFIWLTKWNWCNWWWEMIVWHQCLAITWICRVIQIKLTFYIKIHFIPMAKATLFNYYYYSHHNNNHLKTKRH